VQSTISEPDDEDEELQEVLELLSREAEFQRRAGQHYEHSGGSGGGGVKGLFRRATSMIAAQELLVMMVTTEMTLVVVPPHLPDKVEVMSNLSLPSRPTSSHTASRMTTTISRHCQEFQ
jgi:hypothetical protein